MPRIKPVHWKDFDAFLRKVGCELTREKGDHRVYWRKGLKRPVIIPRDTSLPVFIILNNLKVLGMSREEYLKIISE